MYHKHFVEDHPSNPLWVRSLIYTSFKQPFFLKPKIHPLTAWSFIDEWGLKKSDRGSHMKHLCKTSLKINPVVSQKIVQFFYNTVREKIGSVQAAPVYFYGDRRASLVKLFWNQGKSFRNDVECFPYCHHKWKNYRYPLVATVLDEWIRSKGIRSLKEHFCDTTLKQDQ